MRWPGSYYFQAASQGSLRLHIWHRVPEIEKLPVQGLRPVPEIRLVRPDDAHRPAMRTQRHRLEPHLMSQDRRAHEVPGGDGLLFENRVRRIHLLTLDPVETARLGRVVPL